MRVALIDPSLFTLPYDRALTAGLIRTGNDVSLYGRKLRPPDGNTKPAYLVEAFYHVSESTTVRQLPSALRLASKGVDHGWSMWRLLRRLRRDRPDVIHFQWLALAVLDQVFLNALRRIAPIVLTVHDTNPFNGVASASIQRRGIRSSLARFDRLIVHTTQGEGRLRQLGIDGTRIEVLPHGMLVDVVPVDVPDPMTGPVTFLLFGKIRPYKGADLLIEAMAALPPEIARQARIRIIGEPLMDISPLLARARAVGATIDIETGFVAEDGIPGLFGAGTVATFPYREIEASGVLFLALAHGRPIIASRLGSFAELLVDGVHGRLVTPGDITALSAAMHQMITDRKFAASCAAQVQSLATSIPSWDEIARRTVVAYHIAAMRAHG